jgi:hypothetical protein
MSPRKLFSLLLQVALVFAIGQILLFILLYYFERKYILITISAPLYIFLFPLLTLTLILIEISLFSKYFPKKRNYIFILSWLILFIPNIIPAFSSTFNIFYVVWTFVLSITAIGIVMFQDICLLHNILQGPKANHKFIYDELKFYIDKLAIAWLSLGSALTIIATILWSASTDYFKVGLYERTVINIFMVFAFIIETILIGFFVAIPVLNRMTRARKEILKD